MLSHTLSSEKLVYTTFSIVAIERESMHISWCHLRQLYGCASGHISFNTDKCDILIHINVDVPKYVPAYDRIRAFEDTCTEHNIPYELSLNVSGDSYNDLFSQMKVIFNNIDEKYPDKKKGVFLANDTYANMFLNLVIQKYGCLPDSYEIVGFDNSPIANEAIIPITTIGQQIDVIARTAMDFLVRQMDNRKAKQS